MKPQFKNLTRLKKLYTRQTWFQGCIFKEFFVVITFSKNHIFSQIQQEKTLKKFAQTYLTFRETKLLVGGGKENIHPQHGLPRAKSRFVNAMKYYDRSPYLGINVLFCNLLYFALIESHKNQNTKLIWPKLSVRV